MVQVHLGPPPVFPKGSWGKGTALGEGQEWIEVFKRGFEYFNLVLEPEIDLEPSEAGPNRRGGAKKRSGVLAERRERSGTDFAPTNLHLEN